MKKNVLALGALVLAIGFSAFTVNRFDNKYAVYSSSPTGTDPQTIPSNYTVQSSAPSTQLGSDILAWIRFSDADVDGILDQSELNSFFSTYDTNNDKTLNDQSEVSSILEKKAE